MLHILTSNLEHLTTSEGLGIVDPAFKRGKRIFLYLIYKYFAQNFVLHCREKKFKSRHNTTKLACFLVHLVRFVVSQD